MESEQLAKIVSMIVQNLRLSKHNEIIDIIKNSEYSTKWRDYDNWREIEYCDLEFHVNFDDYMSIYEKRKTYQEVIEKALGTFFHSDSCVIQHVNFVTKIRHFVDWEALNANENKQSIIKKLEIEKKVLTDVGTGILRIEKGINERYKEDHKNLCALLKQLCLNHPNIYMDLWDWYGDYKEKGLSSYQSRRTYINQLYAEIIDIIVNSKEHDSSSARYEPIGWECVDNSIVKMKRILVNASLTEDYQSVGMYGREVLITLAQLVFDKDKHPSIDGTDIGSADSKRMLEAYIHYHLKQRDNPRELKFAKSTIDFSNELTHNRTASALDAELCYNAVSTTISIVGIINRHNK